MAGETASMMFTDPPYGVQYEGKHLKRQRIVNDDAPLPKLRDLLTRAFELAPLRPGAAFYICCPSSDGELAFRNALNDTGLPVRQQIVWVKNHFVISRQDYHWKHEMILYGWKKGGSHYFVADRTQHTVWQYPKPQRSPYHPTTKPLELVKRAVLNSTLPGEIVYDGFGGSGTTLNACDELGRQCRLVEIEPRYCQVVIDRFEKSSGQATRRIQAVN